MGGGGEKGQVTGTRSRLLQCRTGVFRGQGERKKLHMVTVHDADDDKTGNFGVFSEVW